MLPEIVDLADSLQNNPEKNPKRCPACKRSKLGCRGGYPCTHCSKRGLECTLDASEDIKIRNTGGHAFAVTKVAEEICGKRAQAPRMVRSMSEETFRYIPELKRSASVDMQKPEFRRDPQQQSLPKKKIAFKRDNGSRKKQSHYSFQSQSQISSFHGDSFIELLPLTDNIPSEFSQEISVASYSYDNNSYGLPKRNYNAWSFYKSQRNRLYEEFNEVKTTRPCKRLLEGIIDVHSAVIKRRRERAYLGVELDMDMDVDMDLDYGTAIALAAEPATIMANSVEEEMEIVAVAGVLMDLRS